MWIIFAADQDRLSDEMKQYDLTTNKISRKHRAEILIESDVPSQIEPSVDCSFIFCWLENSS